MAKDCADEAERQRASADKGGVLVAEIAGIGKDGGLCRATVPLVGGWRVV